MHLGAHNNSFLSHKELKKKSKPSLLANFIVRMLLMVCIW